MTQEKIGYINLKVKPELKKKIRVFCAQNDTTTQNFVHDLLEEKMIELDNKKINKKDFN